MTPPPVSITVEPFPELPTELVLQILVHACKVSHDTALNVSRSSSWVRSIVLPLVFSTVVRRAGPTMPASSGWVTPQAIRPSSISQALSQRSYAHVLPPTTCDAGKLVKHLWIESIDMMSSPSELDIFNACTNIEDVALTASSLRMLYNLTSFGKRSPPAAVKEKKKGMKKKKDVPDAEVDSDSESSSDTTPSSVVATTIGAASRIRSITLTKHTFRYDWHFLADLNSASETHASLLGNITHLRLTSMEKSPYIPVEYLPNLTHLALPYLHLRSNTKTDLVRVPDRLLRQENDSGNMPTLTMIVLTVDERDWLYRPWKHGAHLRKDSPRSMFAAVRDQAEERDQRLHVVLSPRMGRDVCGEWADAARRGAASLWELAEKSRGREEYANILPTEFPSPDMRYASE